MLRANPRAFPSQGYKKGRTQTRSALKHDKTVKLPGEPKKSRRDKKAVTHRSKNVSVLVCIVIVPSSHFLFLSPRCFCKISAITQFTLLLYKVYHRFLTFSSVQDIFFKFFFKFFDFRVSGNGKQVIWAMNCADFEIRRAEQTKMRKFLPKGESGERRILSWRLREIGVRDKFLPHYKINPKAPPTGSWGSIRFFDFLFYIVLASPIHSGMVTIEIKLTIATV